MSNRNLDKVSFIIVHAKSLSIRQLAKLQTFGKKIVVLSEGKYRGIKLPSNIELIENFLPNAGYYGGPLPEDPNYAALNKLEGIFKKMEVSSINNEAENQAKIQASVWQDQEIAFSGKGPIIINAAYFPDWRSQNPNQKIYQVTPGQMLVFAKGKTNLEFSASAKERASGWISVASIILVIFVGLYLHKKEKAE